MKNFTVLLDDATFAKARMRAAERNISLSRLMSELLERELQQGDAYDAAHRAWRARRPFALEGAPQPYPPREELHDRSLLRRR